MNRTPPPTVPLQAAAFDLDGLMFNTEDVYRDVCSELTRRRGRPIEQGVLDKMMGRPAPQAFQVLIDWYQFTDTIQTLAEETDEIFLARLPSQLQPMPGLVELLDELEKSGVPRGIATSSRRVLVDAILQLCDFMPPLQFILTAEDVQRGKPDPEIYLHAARAFSIAPQQMLVLEDSGVGCRAGVASGAYVVAVPSAHSRHHAFDGVAFQADSLGDPRIVAALGLR